MPSFWLLVSLAGILTIPRLFLFISAMFFHRRWSIAIPDLERVLRAIHGGSTAEPSTPALDDSPSEEGRAG